MKPPLALITDPPVMRVVERGPNGMVRARALLARADDIGPGFLREGTLDGHQAQCGGSTPRGYPQALGGWRFGNTIDGCQAEYVRVPFAMANLTPVPDGLTDEQVLMCPDIMSTGFGGAESGQIKIGDAVAVFAQGGLCATLGARLKGATRIIAVDALPERFEMSRRLGADLTINFREVDPVAEIMRLTEGRGVDVAIEALGTQQTFESCLRVLKPGGVLSSLGVYSGKLTVPLDASRPASAIIGS